LTPRRTLLSSSSSEEQKPAAWLPRVTGVLDGLEVDWVVAGAVAAADYRAEERFTTDLDLLVTWNDQIPEACEAAGYDVRVVADADSTPHLLILHDGSERIDVIVAVVPYQHTAIQRGAAAHVLTIEDVIIHKLIAARPRDRDDIRSILSTDPTLDRAYLDDWIEAWGVDDEWQRLIS